MDRRVTSLKRVTSLTCGSPPLCKQALKLPIIRLSNLSETLPREVTVFIELKTSFTTLLKDKH